MSHTSAPAAALICRTWKGTRIEMRPSDGYVSATAMCRAYGKLFADYWRLERTAQYAQALSGSMGNPIDLLIRKITTGPNYLRGTWIHPRLAVDLARWISPEFAVWMDGWFLDWSQGRSQQAPEPAIPDGADHLARLALEIAQRSLEIAERVSFTTGRPTQLGVSVLQRCRQCGASLHGRHPSTIYCGATCRQRACRSRQRVASLSTGLFA